ncbi:MT-A70 family methyltransferase [Pseudoalteromonas sp. S326]|uniref:MT-A70 family methyltransferase n=1 Tax=Pseudoalteromonas sp. S326 TaxID=579533 RepID=UPI001BB12DDB|nr:MT-A70 family methyltransferase [Pseudoalteromonas sp. S326]
MFEQFNGQKFNLIYADPAWQFSNKKTGGSMKSGAAHHYKSTMSVDELKAMPIDDIAADDCILVMWYVGSMPQEALDVVKAWGFTLKNMNGFVWNKLTINNNPLFGMGFWTRSGSESAIIAVKGKPKVASRSVRAVGNYDTESLDEILGRGVFSGATLSANTAKSQMSLERRVLNWPVMCHASSYFLVSELKAGRFGAMK